MLGGLFVFVFPPLAIIFLLIGGLIASVSAIASNHREQTRTSAPAGPIVPAAVQPDAKCMCGLCGQHLQYSPEMAGQQIACPACQQKIVLPLAESTNEV